VTLQLLWEEYRQGNPDGYRYSRFCELYQRWRSKLDVVLRQACMLLREGDRDADRERVDNGRPDFHGETELQSLELVRFLEPPIR